MTRAVWLALVVISLSGTAAAQEGDALGPCSGDAAKLCADVDAGHGGKMKCLSAHESELTPECKERLTAVKARMLEIVADIEKNCGDDGKKLCPDAKLGAGLLPCLIEHEHELSPACHGWISSHHRPGAAP